MRLADRLFAFRRLPAWTDPVQVLLWILGWGALAGFAALLVLNVLPLVRFSGGTGKVLGLALAVSFLTLLAGALAASWFVSEAYGGWRAGHRHGRQWALLIAGLLLFQVVSGLLGGQRSVAWPTAVVAYHAVAAAVGIALLVAALTTRPPAPGPTTLG